MRSCALVLLVLACAPHIIQTRIRHGRGRGKRQGGWEPGSWVWDEGGGEGGGDWSAWTPPAPCSTSCGGGVSSQNRTCRSNNCWGSPRRFFSCNIEDCGDGRDLRAEQCAEYNHVPYEGVHYDWVPYTKAANKCALNCMPRGERFYYRHQDQVKDGTRCDDESSDVCVNGKCQHVGCDGLLGSSLQEDRCRVCGGDGSSCQTKEDTIRSNDFKVGYNDLFMVPIGATNIKVREVQPSNNYLAVRNASNHYYLNGNWRIDYPRVLKFAGTTFHYGRRPHGFFAPESITALGPTTEILFIVLLYQEHNPGVEYEYSLPTGAVQQTDSDGYTWLTDPFSDCSVTCGTGYQSRRVWCARAKDLSEVSAELCDQALEPSGNQACSMQSCPPDWYVPDWAPCSVSCGNGTQHRQVQCVQVLAGGQTTSMPESVCEERAGAKPEQSQPCGDPAPCPQWHIAPWKPCNALCGDGVERRQVQCFRHVDGNIDLLPDSFCATDMPPKERPCNLRPCQGVDWITSPWSGCGGGCGPAKETREAACASEDGHLYPDTLCHQYRKPDLVRNCSVTECPAQWFASQWSQCSSGCGPGVQTRDVLCGLLEGLSLQRVDDSQCDPALKYSQQQDCVGTGVCTGEWFSTPFSSCSKPCGGGQRSRKVLCLKNNVTVHHSECDSESGVFDSTTEPCNTHPCSEDELITVEPEQAMMDSEEECDYEDYEDEEEDKDQEVESVEMIDVRMADKKKKPVKLEDEEGSGDGSTMFTEESSADSTDTTSEMSSTVQSSSDLSSTAWTSDMSSVHSSSVDSSSVDSSSVDSSSVDTTMSSLASDVSGSSPGTDVSGSVAVTTETMLSDSPAVSGDTSATTMDAEGSTLVSEGSSPDISSTESSTDSSSTETSPESSSESSSWASTLMSSISSLLTTESSSDAASSSDATSDATSDMTSTDATSSSDMTTETSSDTTLTSDTSDSLSSSSMSSVSQSESTSESSVTSSDSTDTSSGSSSPEPTSESVDISSVSPLTTVSGETEETDETSDAMSTTSLSEGLFGVTTREEAVTKEQTPRKCKKKKPSKCLSSEFGCCPDNRTPAKGPFLKECPQAKTCKETKFGCCSDGVSAAGGPNLRGCPPSQCNLTLFGCCPNGEDEALGNEYEGCPQQTTLAMDCASSEFGCCPDGILSATGPDKEGCFDCDHSGPCESCNDTKHGCCPNGVSQALGPDFLGCPDVQMTTELFTFTMSETDSCENSTYGCCDDGVSFADGPDMEGCEKVPCNDTKFGCCPDGVTVARGEEGRGCVEGCDASPFGCCDDRVTPAHGHNKEGCCLASPHGCCQDNIQPALGPNYYGCRCDGSPYGCCPDGVKAAAGPDNEGCGCSYSEHGCCPDGVSAASGPEHHGCGCHTFQFGCCPDGVTHAQGPRQQGCGCEMTAHGCCPDGKTAAPSDGSPCSCDASKYGCCLDGVTPALGDKFDNCTEKSRRPGDVCGLPKDRGPCREFIVKWHYDTEYGGCSRFWYGSCEGNGNRFNSQQECKSVCVEPPGRDACELPVIAGPCKGYYPRWHYDTERKRCTQFVYGGCLGNNNKFNSVEECEALCSVNDHDACDQEVAAGPCRGNYTRWHFSREQQECRPFLYGGCHGNANNFLTEASCSAKCLSPTRLPEECSEGKAEGDCDEKQARWYFDSRENRCMPFYYSGCAGNNNNYNHLDACQQYCPPRLERDTCVMPPQEGTCHNFTLRYYFDSLESRCKQFYYGGCGGNDNNFVDEDHCLARCDPSRERHPPPPPHQPQPEPFHSGMCLEREEVGECSDYVTMWYYDSRDGVCRQFSYGGCAGNNNRFYSEEECQQACSSAQDVCSLPAVEGPCDEAHQAWHYDPQTDSCRPFNYGGCHGNANRYGSSEECEAACVRNHQLYPQATPAPYLPDICFSTPDPGPCLKQVVSWYYDSSTGECRSFNYGGCEGNANRFSSEEQCLRQCGHFRRQDTCLEERHVGSCDDRQEKWYFAYGECHQFVYSGCGGNSNRYSTQEECSSVCLDKQEPPITPGDNSLVAHSGICRLSEEPGYCGERLTRFRYDASRDTCHQFIFTGCSGNLNNFPTYEECLTFCSPSPVQPNEIDVDGGEECAEARRHCASLESCSYGVARQQEGPCDTCSCFDPCAGFDCGSTAECVPQRQADGEFQPVCQPVSQCPENLVDGSCEEECRADSDCAEGLACCYNGCGTSCVPPRTAPQPPAAPQPHPPPVEAPSIVTEEADSKVVTEEGNFATMRCIVHGSPVPHISWLKDDQVLNGSGSKYRMLSDGTLQVVGVIKDDSGIYICVADNGIGGPVRKEFHLTVNVPVKVEVAMEETEFPPGKDISIPCSVDGFPPPTILWFKDHQPLVKSSRISVSEVNRLTIRRAEESDSGTYRCRAENSYSDSEDSVYISVRGVVVPTNCTDNPFFANCALIVQAKYCSHQYYAEFCCKSCTEAGQIEGRRRRRRSAANMPKPPPLPALPPRPPVIPHHL